MKKLLFALTLLVTSQCLLADGATDLSINKEQKCDEHYFSVVKLTVKRPEPIPFTINARGGKVEFASGNLQYQALTKTFRFAERQWEFVGDGVNTTEVKWDSIGDDGSKHQLTSSNLLLGRKYGGWIDLFGWGTSGFVRANIDNNDKYVCNIYPYSSSKATVNETYNTHGYGPSYNLSGVYASIDTTDNVSRNYDWGQNNPIYCKWVGYDLEAVKEHWYCFKYHTSLYYTKSIKIGENVDVYTAYFSFNQKSTIKGTVGSEYIQLTHSGSAGGGTGTTTVTYDRYAAGDVDKMEEVDDNIAFDSTLFEPKVWRVLRDTEWVYLLSTRKIENNQSPSWAYINIQPAVGGEFPGNENGSDPLGLKKEVVGMLIFPDNFELSNALTVGFNSEEVDSIAYGQSDRFRSLTYKSFTSLEKLGVVFLPLAGFRNEKAYTSGRGYYWSATHNAALNAKAVRFDTNNGLDPKDVSSKFYGFSVRLVHDISRKEMHPRSVFK